MCKLLITGGAGFIGANFVCYWLNQHPGDRVVVLDALTYAGNRASLRGAETNADFRFVHGNILNQNLVENLLLNEELDTIVHFAAESHVDRSISGPDAFIETNIAGTHDLLKAARQVWLDERKDEGTFRFHHVSTDEVYGTLGQDDPPFREDTPYAPNSPYAASKASSDHIVRAYHETYGLPVSISNCSNNYGPYQFPEKLIPLMILNMLHGKPLPVYGDGLNIRDWLHVEDHCRGINAILERCCAGETYNIGGNCEKTNMQVLAMLCTTMDRLRPDSPFCPHSSLITHVQDRPGHDRRYAIDPKKITTKLGFRPSKGFEEGIRETVQWYLGNEDWWKELLSKATLQDKDIA